MANVTVKGAPASAAQVSNMAVCCQIAKQLGANAEQMAGALATMTQESTCMNLHGGDSDSAGVFQQRPSMGWGSYAQVTDVAYACRKFLTPYMGYCRKGYSVLAASNAVQRSAYPSAPAQWLPEARRNVQTITGSKDFADTTSLGGLVTSTRSKPYEFSRGSAGQRETSWDAMGRLADEVQWKRFMRGGRLWFVSEAWLAKQTPRFAFATGARGVLGINFDADARRNAAEMTVTALAKRWSVLPGDVCTVSGQGAGNGLWLVTETRRTLSSDSTEITLGRAQPALPEPAPEQETSTVSVGGDVSTSGTAGNQAQQLYAACKAISDRGYPYVWGGGHPTVGTPNGGGYDCSGSVCAALGAVGLGYRIGGTSDVSGTIAARWGAPGKGRWVTVWASAEHVWIQFTGVGPAWRFDTSPHGDGASGARLRNSARSTATFTARHWPGL
jgi:cell wall-associated NlpC family hydrolase